MVKIFSEILFYLKEYNYLIFSGLKNTIIIFIATSLISFFLGFLWGLLRKKTISSKNISYVSEFFAYLIQGIPFYLQLLIGCFIIGPFFGIQEEIIIGICSLGICSAAYTSQIILSGISSIPEEQLLLADNLGYTNYQKIRFIMIPQIISYIIPLFINECDQLLKSISILSTIGILELTRSGLNIINMTFKPLPIYLLLAGIYLFFSFLLRYSAYYYKKKFNTSANTK